MMKQLAVTLALLVVGCAAQEPYRVAQSEVPLPSVVFSPPAGVQADEAARLNSECEAIAAQARADDEERSYPIGTYPYVGIGAVIGVALAEADLENNANNRARVRALMDCYSDRGFLPLVLTQAERRDWRSLRSVDARQDFARRIAADPQRVAEGREFWENLPSAGPKGDVPEDAEAAQTPG